MSEKNFIGYEYKDVIIDKDMETMYIDGYQNFGWILNSVSYPKAGIKKITIKFKRDRKIRNKGELTRLQRQFDASASEIIRMENSKNTSASIVAYTIGLIGTAFIAGATFSFLGGLIALCIILAIPGFLGWILPYFMYNSIYTKKSKRVTPLIENKYDEIYEICERANRLLGN